MRSAAIVCVAILFSWTSAAHAQYFGRNKVQYEKFDFQVLETEHFDIYYYPQEEAAVQLAARMAERWYARLSQLLRHELSSRQPLILYASHPHFQQTHALAGEIGEGTGGVTEMFRRRIIMPFAGGLAETDHVLGHELVHAFQFDMAAQRNAEGDLVGPAVMALPLWFIEGMAEYLSVGPVDANTAMWIRDAVARDRMPTVDDLNDPDFFPYRYGHAFWAYVGGRWGDRAVGDMLRATGPQGNIEAAMERVLGIDEETFSTEWHEASRRTYLPFLETTRAADAFGRPLIVADGTGGDLNIAPALSPDGRHVVFLSERSLFSIDMYLADAATGQVIRKLAETASDPHFESLAFLNSAGDWAPDSRRFVFAAVTRGQPLLTIVDTETGDDEREIVYEDLDEIFNPAWSPDGRRIAFSALHGGLLDLFIVDLETGERQQLTSDPFADLDPEWTPDGRALAWVTDRFASDLDTLSFGDYRIGVMDIGAPGSAPGPARLLAGFEDGRNSNPEFSADGRSLYFIGTPDGIPNIYRVELASGAATQVTNVLSGVSGITPRTPALSVAAASPALVFTVFENDHHNIYLTDSAAQLAGMTTTGVDRDGAMLPPFNREIGDVARILAAPAAGLPSPTQYPASQYQASLGIERVGQPVVGVGADRFGAYAAGGISLLWSDMLGYHQLGTTLQLTNRFEEIGGAVAYLNRRNRWNWGLIGEQTPYVSGRIAQGFVDGEFVEQTERITQINRGLTGVLHYPFSRVQRVEFTGGMRRISFDHDIETLSFSPVTGRQLDEMRQELPRPDALNLGDAGVALVYDSSLFGATSPILGQRYRLEYSQLAGTLLYSGVLADYRRYFMPARPFTIAIRGMHYGRYGRDGEDSRLTPLYIGQQGLVRGYEIGSFDPSECVVTASSTCAAFDRLLGSRVAIAGAELRFPLFGLFNRDTFYGPVPIELALFGDAGTAWSSDIQPEGLGGDREWVRSVGAALRMNAFGYAIIELDYVRPLDRPGKGWHWQFNFTPGF